jgi:hypothetical protein
MTSSMRSIGVPSRYSASASRKYSASADEIVERCVRAIWRKAKELLDRGIVAAEEEADLAFVYAIGFAMYLGGPFFYAEQRGWS